jgi:ADP-ribosyl-[dinitrogen reductase] hydrolase
MTANNEGFAALHQDHRTSAAIGGLVGLLVGDALGVGFEFKKPNQIPPRAQIEMTMPATFRRTYAHVPSGTWSDDGAQALCLLASLIERGKFALTDFAEKLLNWLDHGYLAIDGDVFDVGSQTASALHRLREGMPARESGGATEWDNGNGSLMRVLPLALWHTGPDDVLVKSAHLQSLPTHAHARSLVACAFYCLTARGYLNKLSDPWSWADSRLEAIYRDWSNQSERDALLAELEELRSYPKTDDLRGTGYVLDTIWSARKALEAHSFEDVARTAILFGNDTDTTAAVACGLAGIRFGLAGIPTRWLAELRGIDMVKPLVDQWTATS